MLHVLLCCRNICQTLMDPRCLISVFLLGCLRANDLPRTQLISADQPTVNAIVRNWVTVTLIVSNDGLEHRWKGSFWTWLLTAEFEMLQKVASTLSCRKVWKGRCSYKMMKRCMLWKKLPYIIYHCNYYYAWYLHYSYHVSEQSGDERI